MNYSLRLKGKYFKKVCFCEAIYEYYFFKKYFAVFIYCVGGTCVEAGGQLAGVGSPPPGALERKLRASGSAVNTFVCRVIHQPQILLNQAPIFRG